MNLFDDQQVQCFLDWLDDSFRQTGRDVVQELKSRGLQIESWESLYQLVYSRFYQAELAKVPLIMNANIRSTL